MNNPTLRSHTHWQVAQIHRYIQNLPKSMPAPTHSGQKNGQHTTSCIVHLADSANLKDITFNKLYSGLTDWCFESPNDTIHLTVTANAKKDKTTVSKMNDRHKKPAAQMAHLVSPDTNADPSQNQKSHFLANAPTENHKFEN